MAPIVVVLIGVAATAAISFAGWTATKLMSIDSKVTGLVARVMHLEVDTAENTRQIDETKADLADLRVTVAVIEAGTGG